jgi:hypothetical protein
MAEPGDDTAASGGHARMRAARADRDHAVEVLKTAFVQERLTRDELDARVSRALRARTYADLAALTEDIPAGLVSVPLPVVPPAGAGAGAPGSPARILGVALRRTGMCLTGGLALIGIIFLTAPNQWDFLAFLGTIMSVVAASGFLGYGFIDAWNEWRAERSGPPPGGQDPGDQAGRPEPGQAGSWPGLPRHPGQAQAGRPAPRRPRAALLAGLVVDLSGRGVLLHGLDPAQR